jgi:hypothetical protein
MHPAQAIGGFPLLEVEHGSADGNRFITEREIGELNAYAGLQHGNRAVRGSEIDAEKRLFAIARAHLIIISMVSRSGKADQQLEDLFLGDFFGGVSHCVPSWAESVVGRNNGFRYTYFRALALLGRNGFVLFDVDQIAQFSLWIRGGD